MALPAASVRAQLDLLIRAMATGLAERPARGDAPSGA